MIDRPFNRAESQETLVKAADRHPRSRAYECLSNADTPQQEDLTPTYLPQHL